ncbi:hypothetical protein, partial [Salmonella sp. s51228]|uniref:hypothetical protein n=1 Tax=Salmonella sp. s51228 TaxID=3159652 RepID=UPI00397F75AD
HLEYIVQIKEFAEVTCDKRTPSRKRDTLESSWKWLKCALKDSFIDPRSQLRITFYEMDLAGERFLLRLNDAETIPLDFLHETRRGGFSLLEVEIFRNQTPLRETFDIPSICT